jgi:ABC-type branched-subunit amino acid transport system ATPase component
MEFILSVAQEIAVMDQGRIISTGSPAQIRMSGEVRAAYLGGSAVVNADPSLDGGPGSA